MALSTSMFCATHLWNSFRYVKGKLGTRETAVLHSPFPPVPGKAHLVFCPCFVLADKELAVPPLSSGPPELPIQSRTCFVSFTSEPRIIHKLGFLSHICFCFVQIYNCLILKCGHFFFYMSVANFSPKSNDFL